MISLIVPGFAMLLRATYPEAFKDRILIRLLRDVTRNHKTKKEIQKKPNEKVQKDNQ